MDKVKGNVLVLHRVKRSQIGSYLCIASNGYPPPRSARVELKVNCELCSKYFHHSISDFRPKILRITKKAGLCKA